MRFFAGSRGVLHQIAQHTAVQALPDFAIRISQSIHRLAADILFRVDRQVAGLEQQRLGADFFHVERRQQILGTQHVAQ